VAPTVTAPAATPATDQRIATPPPVEEQPSTGASSAGAVVRDWLAASDWEHSAEYFAGHHGTLNTPEAAAALARIRDEDPDNRTADILAALVDPDFAGQGTVGYAYLTADPVRGLTALIDEVTAQPQLLAGAVRLVEAAVAVGPVQAAAPVIRESPYNAALLRAAQLVVAGDLTRAREEIVAVRPSVPPGQRVLWVDRYQSLRQALPEHDAAFRMLREDIVHCGDPAT
jgi:hypothetical protein